MSNIELFDKVAAHYFALLYSRFPIRDNIDGNEIVEKISKTLSASDRAQWGDELPLFVSESADWLVGHEFIQHDGKNGLELYYCSLTLKGLDAMRSVPSSIKGSESVGDMIKAGVRDGVKGKISEAMGSLIGYAAREMLR
jgi:hypothetical protein